MFKSAFKALLRTLLGGFFRMRTAGFDRLAPADRLLIVANHESLLDGLLIGLFLPFDPVFVVHTSAARRFSFRMVLKLADYVTVDTASPMAIKRIMRTIEKGRPVVIFPEGRVTLTGSLMKIYDGPAFVAARTGATILPVRIDGAVNTYFSRLSGRHPRKLRPRITLTALPVTYIPMPEGRTSRIRRQRAGEAMRRLMQEMLFATRPEETLFDALLSRMSIHGRKRAVMDDVTHANYTYGRLVDISLVLGRICARLTEPGERVGVLLPNVAPTLAILFGLNAFARVQAMLNYTAGREGLQSACGAARIKTVITSKRFVKKSHLEDKIAHLENISVVYLEDLKTSVRLKDKLWLIAWARWFPRWVRHKLAPESPAVVLFTSGSEGTPKGVVLSHNALLANVAQLRTVVDISATDRFLNALPLFHSFGLTGGALLPLFSGAETFLYPSPLHYKVIPELAYERGCTILLGTSTFLGNYARFAHPYDFYRLRYVVSGAEKLASQVKDLWFEKFGIRIFEGYGATETAPVMALNTPMAYRSETVGQLLPGLRSKIVPVAGLERGGVLHVKGPNVMSGYLRVERPGVLEPPVSDAGPGWYDTGDVVSIDEDGFVRIVGRVKRFAKIAGEMVSLEVVEKLAALASPDHLHAALGRPDAARGESIQLYTTDPALSRSRLQEMAREQGVPEIAVPRRVVHIDAIPQLGTGKTDYVALRQREAV